MIANGRFSARARLVLKDSRGEDVYRGITIEQHFGVDETESRNIAEKIRVNNSTHNSMILSHIRCTYTVEL